MQMGWGSCDMKQKVQKIFAMFLVLALASLFNFGCAGIVKNEEEEKETPTAVEVEKADSLDAAVIVKIDESTKKITFRTMQLGKDYTLTYDGTTILKNKYGEEQVMEQFSEGDLVMVTFLKNKKIAKSIQSNESAFEKTDITQFEINKIAKTMNFGDKQFELDDHVVVTSAGEKIELMDISAADTLTVSGISHVIHSITVQKGHGYLRLENDEYFIGGWIEVGQGIIKPVTEDMLLVVPEGSYQVLISNTGYGGTKDVVIEKNKETVVDVADLKGEDAKIGSIVFTVAPEDAVLYLDGNKTDYSEKIDLEYGIHQMIWKATGYQTISQYIKVGQELANIDIQMEATTEDSGDEEDTDDTEDSEDTTVSEDVISSTSDFRVYIDAPVGAELYLDGSYVGIVPIDFAKVAGSYTLSVRKTGYQTRSYSLQIDNTKKDVTYTFSDLEVISE